jgi:magnesium chelatase subunit H
MSSVEARLTELGSTLPAPPAAAGAYVPAVRTGNLLYLAGTLPMKDGKATVDAVINLTGFSLVGGPAYSDAKAAEEILTRLDRPYISAHPVEFQTLQQWGANRQGLLPLEATIMIAIPELDGGTQPMVFGGRSDAGGEACTGCSRATIPVPASRRANHQRN